MYKPPSDSQDRPLVDQPTWRGVLAAYAAMAVFPASLFAASQPLAAAAVLAGVAALAVGARRAVVLAACFRDCRGFAFDLAGRVRITVSQPSACDPCSSP